MSACRSCGAPIFFAKTTTGGTMPLDEQPENRVVLDASAGEPPVARVVRTYTSHFATCPDAARFRRPKEPKPKG
jgi:hypothetical protein